MTLSRTPSGCLIESIHNGLGLRSPGRQSIQDPHPLIAIPSAHCFPLPLSAKVGTRAAKYTPVSTAGEKLTCLPGSQIQKTSPVVPPTTVSISTVIIRITADHRTMECRARGRMEQIL